MDSLLTTPLLTLLTLALTLALEAAYISVVRRNLPALRTRHLAADGGRSVTGGGFIFFISVLAGALAVRWPRLALPALAHISCIPGVELGLPMWLPVAGAALLWVVSFADDAGGLSPWLRLVVQTVAALSAALMVPMSGGWWILPCVVLLVWLTNSFNFMDGICGMLALYGLVTVGFLCLVVPPDLQPIAWCLLAAVAVFAYFNVGRTDTVFCGDVGSVTLGFIAGWLLLEVVPAAGWGVFAAVAVFMADTGVTLAMRLWHGENVLQSHRRHLYQQLADGRGWSHRRVAETYAGAQLFIDLGLLCLLPGPQWVSGTYCAIVYAAAVGVRLVCHRSDLCR